MTFSRLQLHLIFAAVFVHGLGCAMDIQWTRMAGQWPVEASPLVGNFAGGHKDEILVLNRGGQILHWDADGTAIGSGQGGLVSQLPEGRWTTASTLIENPSGARLVVASVEGRVIGLDRKFQPIWQHTLPGETVWGCAVPAVFRAGAISFLVFTDSSGLATCLTGEGKVAWTNALGAGPCKASPQIFPEGSGENCILIPAGSTLFCCQTNGAIQWQRDLGKEILTRPEVLVDGDRSLILCGTAEGKLFAVRLGGEVAWECETGDTFSRSIGFLPRPDAPPLIIFTGLWGNLHAVDVHGRHIWTHLFRAKVRGAPLVLDADGDGHSEIFVPTFHQHVYQFNDAGKLKDDVRLSGIIPSAVVPIPGSVSNPPDLLVTTTTLLAYRLRPSLPKSQYGKTSQLQNVRMYPPVEDLSEAPSLVVENPDGGLMSVNVSMTDTQGWTRLVGRVTARSVFEIPLPAYARTNGWSLRASVENEYGQVLNEESWILPGLAAKQEATPELCVWATPAFGSFAETRLAPLAREIDPNKTNQVSIQSVCLDEVDEGAFILASTRDETIRARVTVSRPARKDGVLFDGTIVLRQVLPTGSVNGESVADALPALGESGLVTLPARRSIKLWVSVDTHGAEAGTYSAKIAIVALQPGIAKLELPLNLEVVDLRLPKEFPLRLCTWDYVPNRWFSSRTKEVLDDMARHGVNIFPRTIIPSARLDSTDRLTIDWTAFDAELGRLKNRGKLLLQLSRPPIEFGGEKSAQQKHSLELQYVRAVRDHLQQQGWNYPDYAFYPLDEPGLDYGTNVPVLLEAGKLLREADPRLLIYTDPVPGLSWKDFERIEPLVDVWSPNMRLVSGLLSGDPRIKRIMNGKAVWSYECVAQVKSISPLRYNRANAWRAKFFGLSGIGFWTHSTTEVDLWIPGRTTEDEYALVYPGELPVPSVRWEAVRDGLEDVAAITLLEEQIQRNRMAGTRNELVQTAEQTLRIALRDIMELSDEAFVESRDYLQAGDRLLPHTWTDLEMYRRHRADIARLTLALSPK